MADKNFYTVDPNVVTDCCESMRDDREVAINIYTPSGRDEVRGKVRRIRRLTDGRFKVWVQE